MRCRLNEMLRLENRFDIILNGKVEGRDYCRADGMLERKESYDIAADKVIKKKHYDEYGLKVIRAEQPNERYLLGTLASRFN